MPNKLSRFWQELKRRKVIHVITVYAGAAFVIIELINNVTEPLKLPEWTPTLVIIILLVGFPLAVIFSWIYDIHPEKGIVETEQASDAKAGQTSKSSSGWKIATYVSIVVIIGLIALNIFGGRNKDRIDESLAKSIAVLPFHNLSGDDEQDHMSIGITDEIINHLFKLRSFDEVRSLTSIFKYKDSEENILTIAEELKVNYILEGTYKRVGDKLKITAQLIEARSDKHIWLHDYDLPYSEVIGIPAEIAIQIADHLKAFITEDELQRIEKISTSNQEAYELLQQAKHLIYTTSTGYIRLEQRMDLCLKAIELAPDYADAYAAVGSTILSFAGFTGRKEMQTTGWESLPYLEKALDLDPDNARAYVGLAMFYEWFRWDYIEAERNYLKAMKLRPGETMNTFTQYGEFLVKMDRMEEAAAFYANNISYYYNDYRKIIREIFTGDRSDAIHSLEVFKEKHPGSGFYKWIGDIYMRLEQYDSALHYMESAVQSGDQEMLTVPRHHADLALACYRLGELQRATSIIGELETMSLKSSAKSPDYFTGWYFSAIGEVDSAFYWLEKAYQNRSPELPWLKVDPVFESLKGNDRYWDLYERTGHKAYDDYMASKRE